MPKRNDLDLKSKTGSGKMTVVSAASMGIGAMVGAGIFALLGEAAEIAGNLVCLSFFLAGLITLLIGYSYAKLGTRYPSKGGPIEYLFQGFGTTVFAGGLNILYWIAIISGIAMVAKSFGNYASALILDEHSEFYSRVFTLLVILFFTFLNFIGSKAIGNLEKWIVVAKLLILVVFSIVSIYFIDWDLLTPEYHLKESSISVINAIGLVFFSFTGFGIITNTTEDLRNPSKELPRAIFLCISIVIIVYILIALAVTGNLPYDQITNAKDYALAKAAEPIFGSWGFKVMAVAALLSTASAINASLYGAANISFMIAKKGELPIFFENRRWNQGTDGLLITSFLIFVMAFFLDLESIASVGSAIMLLIYVLVNVGHLKLLKETGAKRGYVWLGLILCSSLLIYFLVYSSKSDLKVVSIFFISIVLSFVLEYIIQKYIGRELKLRIK